MKLHSKLHYFSIFRALCIRRKLQSIWCWLTILANLLLYKSLLTQEMQCFMVVCLDISTPRNVEANCFHFFLAPARHLRAHSPMTRRFTSCGDFPKYFDRKSKVGLTYKIFWKKVQIREVAPVLIKCYNQLFWFPSSEIWLDFGVKIIFQKIELFICLWLIWLIDIALLFHF